MNDFSTAYISKLIVHMIGNKSKGEDLILSSQLSEIESDFTEQNIVKFFINAFKYDSAYEFSHEADINLNEIYSYSSKIFQNENILQEQSINIAKHLYEVSSHPNIKVGELYISYIKGCIIDNISTDIIGIIKSESKDYYLDIINNDKKIDVTCKKGVNINKLDKGCLICNMGTDYPQKVFIVDTGKNDTQYWKNLFLNAKEISNEYKNTSTILKTCKQFIQKACNNVEPTDKITMLNNSVQYFENHDSFEINDFKTNVFADETLYNDFKNYIDVVVPMDTFEKPFDISKKAVSAVKRNIKNYIKLDSNIEIRINTQTKAVEKMFEKGYDKNKKMSYYKIYFEKEE